VKRAIAIVICNWNKREDLLTCIDSIYHSDFQDFDVIVVDNASEDDSVDALRSSRFPVRIIENKINLGGSGGFNNGIKAALADDYTYIHLLDNDVILAPDAIRQLYQYLEMHANVGMLGSKLLLMGEPNRLQEYGSFINWNEFNISPLNKGVMDNEGIAEIMECDYVPACSVMIRTEALRHVGLMDSHYFIYWDDIDWGYRMNRAGYKVAAYGKSKVWHKMGAGNRTSTFPTYYFWRNRIHFFVQYCPRERFDSLASVFFNELFKAVYFSRQRKQYSIVQTLIHAFHDAAGGIRNKAGQGRIQIRENVPNRLEELLAERGDAKALLLHDCSDGHALQAIVRSIRSVWSKKIYFRLKHQTKEWVANQCGNVEILNEELYGSFINVQACNHLYDIRNEWSSETADLYVDSYGNIAATEQDRVHLLQYDKELESAQRLYYPFFLSKLLDAKSQMEGERE